MYVLETVVPMNLVRAVGLLELLTIMLKARFTWQKDKNIDGSDYREGLSAVLSVKIPEELLEFEGQTKGKLGTPQARSAVDSLVYEKMSYYLMEMVS